MVLEKDIKWNEKLFIEYLKNNDYVFIASSDRFNNNIVMYNCKELLEMHEKSGCIELLFKKNPYRMNVFKFVKGVIYD